MNPRFALAALALCLPLCASGCAMRSSRSRPVVWCEHAGFRGEPHGVDVPSPYPLDLDLITGPDPVATAGIRAYLAAVESGSERNRGLLLQAAPWLPRCQGLAYATRIQLEEAIRSGEPLPAQEPWEHVTWRPQQRRIEHAYRRILENAEPGLLALPKAEVEAQLDSLLQLSALLHVAGRHAYEVRWRVPALMVRERGARKARVTWDDAGSFRAEAVSASHDLDVFIRQGQGALDDYTFKHLLEIVRQAWSLGPRDSEPVVQALKAWRHQTRIAAFGRAGRVRRYAHEAERYRDRALDAALDASVSAERARKVR